MRMKRHRRRRSGSTRPRATRTALAKKALLRSDACAHLETGGPTGSARWPTIAQLGYSMLPTLRRFYFATHTSYPAVSNADLLGTKAKPATQSRKRTPTSQNALLSSTGSLMRSVVLISQASSSQTFRLHAMYIANLASSVIARRHCLSKCLPQWLGACFAVTLPGEQRWQRQSAQMMWQLQLFRIMPLRL